MKFVVGGRGRLGGAIASHYPAQEVRILERAQYATWSQPGAADQVSRVFASIAHAGDTVFVASGLLDPSTAPNDLHAVNVALPQNIVEGATKLGLRVVTFGTVMEALLTRNPYVQSKVALGERVAQAAADGASVMHLRIHTLYGNRKPSAFMFLGQMLDALRRDADFAMTSGRQLREYHHVDDDARAIRVLADANVNGVLDLSHGQPVTLRRISEAVFEALGKLHRLRLGALPEPAEENFEWVFARPALLGDCTFRDTLPAIVDYIEDCLDDAHAPRARSVGER